MELVIALATVLVLAAGIMLWVRWLGRRQRVWRVRLSDLIPVHSKFWRERAKQPGELLYVAIGDSAAQGIGASRPDRSYVGVLAGHIQNTTGRPVRVRNLATSGATVGIAIENQLPLLAKLTPDILTVSIGANDIVSFDAARFEREIGVLFDALPPHAIVADLPSFYFLPSQKRVKVANDIVTRAAQKRGLTVVPLHKRTDRQGVWGVVTQFAGDLFHPNDRGYRIWASAFVPAIDRRLGEL